MTLLNGSIQMIFVMGGREKKQHKIPKKLLVEESSRPWYRAQLNSKKHYLILIEHRPPTLSISDFTCMAQWRSPYPQGDLTFPFRRWNNRIAEIIVRKTISSYTIQRGGHVSISMTYNITLKIVTSGYKRTLNLIFSYYKYILV